MTDGSGVGLDSIAAEEAVTFGALASLTSALGVGLHRHVPCTLAADIGGLHAASVCDDETGRIAVEERRVMHGAASTSGELAHPASVSAGTVFFVA